MFGFHSRKPLIGLDITAAEIRAAAVAGTNAKTSVATAGSATVPAGAMNETFSSPSLTDPEGLSAAIRELLARLALPRTRRVSVSLPDALFRVQVFEFDSLPASAEDRERLIRWRFEKSSAFDASDTLLRYQVVHRREQGTVLLASIAKRSAIRQYEDLLLCLGLDPWTISPSSFHTVNLYAPHLAAAGPVCAVAMVHTTSFVTMVVEHGMPRFYRFKEVKAGNPDEVRDRLVREIDDSLHFYMHMDRAQPAEIGRLSLAGDRADLNAFASRLEACSSLPLELLAPAVVLGRGGTEPLPAAMAAALGAGRTPV